MKISLEQIVIYNEKGEERVVSFQDGLNVITGYSKTGKSALIDILNYCFFSKTSNIPKGIIDEFAFIYVLVLKIGESFLVIGREQKNQNQCYIFDIKSLSDLNFQSFNNEKTGINVDNAKNLLLKKFGINIEEKYGTLNTGAVSIRNILPLLLQPQHLIANKYALFINFDDYIRKTAIIEEFPYFLKIINNDYLKLKRRLDEIKKEIKKEDNQIVAREIQYSNIRNRLKNEIIDFLLNLGVNKEGISNDINDLLEINLDDLFDKKFNSNLYNYSLSKDNIIANRKERANLNKKLQDINNQLNFIDVTDNEINKYYDNINTLKLISHEQKDFVPSECFCPLCSAKVKTLNEKTNFIDDNINFLSKEVINLEYYDQNIESKRSELLKQKNSIKEEIKSINDYMLTLENIDKNNEHTIYEKLIVLKTKINTEKEYLNELMSLDKSDLKNKFSQEIIEIEGKLNDYNIKEKLSTLNHYLNEKINSICGRLDVEEQFLPSKLEFDFNMFTLYYNNNGERTYLSEIGSGANILAWHISLFLGLLWLSLKVDSFLPKFIIIDQPTQVYFPEKNTNINSNNDIYSKRIDDKDFQNVEKLYTVILEELDKMKGVFGYSPQVIIMDHANNLNLGDKYNFSDYVRENWRDGSKLI